MTPEAAFRALEEHLRRWDARRRQATLLAWLPRAVALGLLPALVLALAARARPLLLAGEIGLIAVALAAVAVAALAVLVFIRRRSLVEQARFADDRFALRERATAAVEIHAGQHDVSPGLAARQLHDALAAAEAVDLNRQLPLTTRPADWLPALATLAALLAALWLPNPQTALLRQQRAVAAAVGQQAEALESLSEAIAANPGLTPEQQAALQQPLDEALATLNEPGVSQAEALAALSEAETEMRQLGQAFDHAEAAAALAAAADALSRSEAAAGLSQALQDAQPGAAAAAAGALAAALPQLDAAAQDQLAEGLAEAADALREADPALADQLDRAAAALAEGDTAAATEALDEAAANLSQQAQDAAAATAAGQAADQLGAARQEVAAAGQPATGQEQAGAAQQSGEGTGQNSGESASGGQGQDGGAGGAGNAGGQAGGNSGADSGANTGGPGPGGGHVESVFVPAPADLSGQGQDVELEVQCLSGAADCGPLGEQLPSDPNAAAGGGSFVPFDQVFGDYRDAAFEALPGSGIPPGLQGLVRDYFSALEP